MELWLYIHIETFEVLYVTSDYEQAHSVFDRYPNAALTSFVVPEEILEDI